MHYVLPTMKNEHPMRFFYGNLDLLSISYLVVGESYFDKTKPLGMGKELIELEAFHTVRFIT